MDKNKKNDKKNTVSENETELNKLKQEVSSLKNQVEDFNNKYLRALADYQNFENRVRSDRVKTTDEATSTFLLKLLPFLDNLEKAEIFIKDKGLKIIKEQLEKIIKESGVEEIPVINKEYDPYTAEVIEMVAGDKDNFVTEVLRKGYKKGDRILRVAQVKVSKKNS